jgi:hypothetical protein
MEDLNKDETQSVAETTTEMLGDMSGISEQPVDIVTAISNFFFDNANNPEMLTNVLNDGIESAKERERSTDVITDVEISNDVLSFAEEAASFVPVFQGADEIKNVEPFVKELSDIANKQNGFTTIPNLTVSMTSEQLALLGNTHGGSFINNIGNADLTAVPANAVTSGNLDSFYKANALKAERDISIPDPGYDPTVDYSTTILTPHGIIKDTANVQSLEEFLNAPTEGKVIFTETQPTLLVADDLAEINKTMVNKELAYEAIVTGVTETATIASELSTVNLVQESCGVNAEDLDLKIQQSSAFGIFKQIDPNVVLNEPMVFPTNTEAVSIALVEDPNVFEDGLVIPVVNVLTDVEASPNLEEHLKTISEADAKYAFELGNTIGKPMLAHSLMMKKLVEMTGNADIVSSLIPEQQVIATPIDPTKPIESDVDVFSIPDVLESENEIEQVKPANVKIQQSGLSGSFKSPNAQLAAFAAIAAGLNASNGFNDLNMPAYLPVPNLKHLKRSGTPNSLNVLKTRAKNKAAAKARKRNRK